MSSTKGSKRFISLVIKHIRLAPDNQRIKYAEFLILQGGNDYEIFTDHRTIGHAVSSPTDTLRILAELFP
jgi:hypothetical protein